MDDTGFVNRLWSPLTREGQPFIWYAKKEDGSTVYECDDDSNTELYDSLDHTDVTEFGFLGMGGKLYINTSNGILTLDGDRDVNVFIIDRNDEDRFDITNNPSLDYKKFFEYKQFICNFNPMSSQKEQQADSQISSYTFGHEGDFTFKDIEFSYKLSYRLDMSGKGINTVNFGLLANKNWVGDLHLTCLANDFVKDSIFIPKHNKKSNGGMKTNKDYHWFSIGI